MIGLYWIHVNGDVIDLKRSAMSLSLLQAMVATGMTQASIELLPMPQYAPGVIDQRKMCVNEEGRVHDLPLNPAASEMIGMNIFGDVVLIVEPANDHAA